VKYTMWTLAVTGAAASALAVRTAVTPCSGTEFGCIFPTLQALYLAGVGVTELILALALGISVAIRRRRGTSTPDQGTPLLVLPAVCAVLLLFSFGVIETGRPLVLVRFSLAMIWIYYFALILDVAIGVVAAGAATRRHQWGWVTVIVIPTLLNGLICSYVTDLSRIINSTRFVPFADPWSFPFAYRDTPPQTGQDLLFGLFIPECLALLTVAYGPTINHRLRARAETPTPLVDAIP